MRPPSCCYYDKGDQLSSSSERGGPTQHGVFVAIIPFPSSEWLPGLLQLMSEECEQSTAGSSHYLPTYTLSTSLGTLLLHMWPTSEEGQGAHPPHTDQRERISIALQDAILTTAGTTPRSSLWTHSIIIMMDRSQSPPSPRGLLTSSSLPYQPTNLLT